MPISSMSGTTLQIHAPSELHTSSPDRNTSHLSGQISASFSRRLPSTSPNHITIFLIRVGQLKTITRVINGLISAKPLSFLKFKKKSDWCRFAEAEKLIENPILVASTEEYTRSDGYTAGKWVFDLEIPRHLPPTTNTQLASISYALVVELTSADGRSAWAGQELRILRQKLANPVLRQCLDVTFPQSSLVVDIHFSDPRLGPRLTIPTTIRLKGLKVTMGRAETKRVVLRELRWKVQEIGLLVSGDIDGFGQQSASNVSRSEYRHTISRGRGKSKSRCLSQDSRDKHTGDIEVTEYFEVFLPKQTDLDNDTEQSSLGTPNSQPALCSVLRSSRESTANLKQWFTVQVQHELQICLRVGEDTFDRATGNLVERRDLQRVYTVVYPILMRERRAQSVRSCEGLSVPAYEPDREIPPPPYVPN